MTQRLENVLNSKHSIFLSIHTSSICIRPPICSFIHHPSIYSLSVNISTSQLEHTPIHRSSQISSMYCNLKADIIPADIVQTTFYLYRKSNQQEVSSENTTYLTINLFEDRQSAISPPRHPPIISHTPRCVCSFFPVCRASLPARSSVPVSHLIHDNVTPTMEHQ